MCRWFRSRGRRRGRDSGRTGGSLVGGECTECTVTMCGVLLAVAWRKSSRKTVLQRAMRAYQRLPLQTSESERAESEQTAGVTCLIPRRFACSSFRQNGLRLQWHTRVSCRQCCTIACWSEHQQAGLKARRYCVVSLLLLVPLFLLFFMCFCVVAIVCFAEFHRHSVTLLTIVRPDHFPLSTTKWTAFRVEEPLLQSLLKTLHEHQTKRNPIGYFLLQFRFLRAEKLQWCVSFVYACCQWKRGPDRVVHAQWRRRSCMCVDIVNRGCVRGDANWQLYSRPLTGVVCLSYTIIVCALAEQKLALTSCQSTAVKKYPYQPHYLSRIATHTIECLVYSGHFQHCSSAA